MTEKKLKERLTPEQYKVTQEKGTEAPFSGKYTDCKLDGTYHCICCDASLFQSNVKFDSKSGWPSFSDKEDNAIQECRDESHGMTRVEVTCKSCGAHLGHVFDDGPAPTGLRYCINSASLNLKEKK